MTTPPDKPKRWQFGLKSLLIAMTGICLLVWGAVVVWNANLCRYGEIQHWQVEAASMALDELGPSATLQQIQAHVNGNARARVNTASFDAVIDARELYYRSHPQEAAPAQD
jgi:hypothetical protein